MRPPGRAAGALRLAELAGVTTAPGDDPAAGGSGDRGRSGEWCEVLGAAAAEVTRQEARVDDKAGQLAGLAGTLSTLAVGAASVVGALAPRVSGWLVWSAVPLLVAALLWAAAVVVLLRRIVRPQLASVGRGSFVNPDHVEQLRAMSLVDYRQALVSRLDAVVVRRYRAVGLAADLLVAGFVPLLAAGVAAGVAGLWAVVA